MSDGFRKADKDFSKEVDKQLPEAEDIAKVFIIATHRLPGLICHRKILKRQSTNSSSSRNKQDKLGRSHRLGFNRI